MNFQKRVVSLILCLAMTLSFLTPVYAEELPAAEAPAIVAQEVETPEQPAPSTEETETTEEAKEELSEPEQPKNEEAAAPAEEAAVEEPATDTPPVENLPSEEPAPSPVEEPAAPKETEEAAVVEEPKAPRKAKETPVVTKPAPAPTQPKARTAPKKGTLNITRLSLNVGSTASLKLSGAAVDEFESGKPSVASVSKKGVVTAKTAGTTSITVTDTNDQEYICIVDVDGVISNKSVTLSETKTAAVSLKGGKIASVVSSNPKIATVTKAGKITAVKNGKCVVTVKDTVGNTYQCTVTVTPSYLARMAKNAQYVYKLVVKLHCRPGIGSRTLSILKKKKKVSCNAAASIAMQMSGILKYNVTMGHTPARHGNEVRKKNTIKKAIKKTDKLIKGTYTIVRVGKKYSKLPAKYKKAGMIYVQDSNMCVSAGGGYIYSCNEAPNQLRHGRYYRTKVKSGYPFNHPILYVIAPKE